MRLGKLVSDARGRAKLTQAELAIRARVDPRQVPRWERGAALPKAAAVLRLSVALGLSVEALATAWIMDRAERDA
uniref:HTH_XRE domain containing protein n=1 Tax=uncultured Caudovirales phage TaxID=2100421 RepID=A0A6J5LAD5_9CAUD|nr:HTH_XRE domain containing protein [uncultured Caudovirales phage]